MGLSDLEGFDPCELDLGELDLGELDLCEPDLRELDLRERDLCSSESNPALEPDREVDPVIALRCRSSPILVNDRTGCHATAHVPMLDLTHRDITRRPEIIHMVVCVILINAILKKEVICLNCMVTVTAANKSV